MQSNRELRIAPQCISSDLNTHNTTVHLCVCELPELSTSPVKRRCAEQVSLAEARREAAKYYVAPRSPDALKEYFESNTEWGDFQEVFDENRSVCGTCAGNCEPHKHCGKEMVCQTCGKSGHGRYQCPRRRCTDCLQLGHWAQSKDCPCEAVCEIV